VANPFFLISTSLGYFYPQIIINTNKKTATCFSNRLPFSKSTKFYTANYRLPAGFIPQATTT
jgi:hypothetical protein